MLEREPSADGEGALAGRADGRLVVQPRGEVLLVPVRRAEAELGDEVLHVNGRAGARDLQERHAGRQQRGDPRGLVEVVP